MQKARASRYGQETEVRADINPKTGEIRFLAPAAGRRADRKRRHADRLARRPEEEPVRADRDWIAESLPPFDFGRIPANPPNRCWSRKSARPSATAIDVYKDCIGEIINGVGPSGVEYGNVVVDLGGSGAGEAVVRRDEMIPRENVPPGRSHSRLCLDVRREQRGPQIFCRARIPNFTAKLFAQEVPEIFTTASSRSVSRPRSRLARPKSR